MYRQPKMGSYTIIKRVIDVSMSLIFLVLFSPLLLILAVSMWVSGGNPVIFSSERVGKDKKSFIVYKFRTLVNGISRRKDGLSDKIVINGLAQFMRDTHLDEVLQLINVLKGDMSLIGPRPIDVQRYHHLKSKDSTWSRILKIKPGMTCINQIARYAESGLDKVKELKGLKNLKRRNRLLLDKNYMKHRSPLLDLTITLWTIEYLIGGFFIKMLKWGKLK